MQERNQYEVTLSARQSEDERRIHYMSLPFSLVDMKLHARFVSVYKHAL